jgi:hypothetical protein
VTRLNWQAAALVAVVAVGSASLFVRAADDAKPAPAKAAAKAADGEKKEKKPAKLTKPWSELTTLSEDQSNKIRDIHAKALAERKAIEDKEEADIMALLTDAQKSELKSIAEADAAAKKAAAPKKEKAAAKEGDSTAKPAATKAP